MDARYEALKIFPYADVMLVEQQRYLVEWKSCLDIFLNVDHEINPNKFHVVLSMHKISFINYGKKSRIYIHLSNLNEYYPVEELKTTIFAVKPVLISLKMYIIPD